MPAKKQKKCSLWRMRMLHGFEQSSMVNARVSASKMGFFQWREGYGPGSDEDGEDIQIDAEPGTFRARAQARSASERPRPRRNV